MDKAEARRALKSVLAGLYPAREDAVRVVTDAGLAPTQIAFSAKAINSWHNILDEAEKQGRVGALVGIALQEYPSRSALREAYEDYMAALDEQETAPPPAGGEPAIDLLVVRELLAAAFTAADLRRFCYYRPHLREVLDGFADKPSLNDLVDALLEFGETRGLLADLLRDVEAERPRQYERFRSHLYQTPSAGP
jgi:hypothetical protein